MRSGERGFTLVELMVVLVIIGLATAAVMLAIPDQGGSLQAEAERFAARAKAARDSAIVESRPAALIVGPAGYDVARRSAANGTGRRTMTGPKAPRSKRRAPRADASASIRPALPNRSSSSSAAASAGSRSRSARTEASMSVASQRESGFTLIEMLVALAIFSLAALALLRLGGATAANSARLHDQAMAQMVARNLAVETLTDPAPPPFGRPTGEAVNAGRRWMLDAHDGPLARGANPADRDPGGQSDGRPRPRAL